MTKINSEGKERRIAKDSKIEMGSREDEAEYKEMLGNVMRGREFTHKNQELSLN